MKNRFFHCCIYTRRGYDSSEGKHYIFAANVVDDKGAIQVLRGLPLTALQQAKKPSYQNSRLAPPESYRGASLCGGLSSPEYEYNNTQSNQTDQSILA